MTKLADIAAAMVTPGKGILAADESTASIQKRFESIKTDCTADSRRDYREMFFSAKDTMQSYVSGVILFDETLRQSSRGGTPLAEMISATGAVPGIKLDTGAKPLALQSGETVTEGLDGLAGRVAEYVKLGAKFAKWRAVIDPTGKNPSHNAIHANVHALARYAAICQAGGLVPMVEPEVLMDGDHDIETCYEVTEVTLRSLFDALYQFNVDLQGTILKASMVISGKGCDEQASVDEVADYTLMCLKTNVPAILPGIVFLSGGQSDEDATAHLNAMNEIGENPWPLSFSYGRAMQSAALKIWSQDLVGNVGKAQETVFARARDNGLAALGQLND